MYKFDEIIDLHLELTSNCQAKCPMCARNHHGGLVNPLIKIQSLNLLDIQKIIDINFIKQLDTILMCGNFGDPIINDELIPIIKYFVDNNADIGIDIHTNGSARSIEWWKTLAKVLPKRHTVHFAIDGLNDTHHLYRIGTNFDKIIENAKSFISSGGIARWVFITFKHNEHQLEDAKQMAEELGFKEFYEKQTSRFIVNPWFDVLDKDGNFSYKLEPPSNKKTISVKKEDIENYKEVLNSATIQCRVKSAKSIYIDSLGYVWPCCYVGATPYLYSQQTDLTQDYKKYSLNRLNDIIDKFGTIEDLNLHKKNIKEIVNSDKWQELWDRGIEDKLPVCARTCGTFKTPTISQSKDQFIKLEKFSEQ